MDPPESARRNDQACVFVCYSHKDRELVYPEISWLQEQGINVWYDEGISAGRVWRAEIAQAIDACSNVLFYVSKSSLDSAHCNREINLALDLEKPILPVYLGDVQLTDDLRVGLSRVQALHRSRDANYRQRLLTSLAPKSLIDTPTPELPARSWRRSILVFVGILLAGFISWWALQERGAYVSNDRLNFDSIAILPFTDASETENLGSLAELITRQLVTRLDELQSINVASTAAVTPLVQQGLSLPEIARELNTPIALSGYVHGIDQGYEIPVEIFRAADGRVLWSETLRRRGKDTNLTARFVSGELSRFLATTSTAQEPGPVTPDAYRAWLNWHFHSANYRNWEEVKWIEQVIRLEPSYITAHLDAYQSYYYAALDGRDPTWVERAADALDAARQAGLEKHPRYLWSQGTYLMHLTGDLRNGEPYFRESGSPQYAALLADSGVPEPAIKVFEAVTTENPSNAGGWLGLGFARGMNGDLSGALAAFEGGLERNPDHPYLLLNHSRALIFMGDYDRAERSLARLEALEPLPSGSHLAIRVNRYRLEGKRGYVEAATQGAAQLASEGWHATAGTLFLEFGDRRAKEQFRMAAERPVAGRRMVSSWLYLDPSRQNNPSVGEYLDSLGFTTEWREEICNRAHAYAAIYNARLSCEVTTPPN